MVPPIPPPPAAPLLLPLITPLPPPRPTPLACLASSWIPRYFQYSLTHLCLLLSISIPHPLPITSQYFNLSMPSDPGDTIGDYCQKSRDAHRLPDRGQYSCSRSIGRTGFTNASSKRGFSSSPSPASPRHTVVAIGTSQFQSLTT